jgi:subtilisin family serine protease
MWLRLINKIIAQLAARLQKKACWLIAVFCILAPASVLAEPQADRPQPGSLYPAFAPGELLVKFRSEVRKQAAADYQEWFNISTGRTFAINGYQHVKLPEGVDIDEALELYLEDPDVEHAEPNYLLFANATIPDDTDFNKQWGLDNNGQNVNGTSGTPGADIDAPEAWDVTTGSSNVIVAVVDSGVDINHPDLQANIWTNPGEIPGNLFDDDGNGLTDDVNGWDFLNNDNTPDDPFGHGTHVAGTVAAVGDNAVGTTGVSWTAKIMPLRFLDALGYGYTADAIDAIEYATAMGADVINNSWGGSGPSSALKDAIEASGAVVVCAAGNTIAGGRNNDAIPHYPSSYNSANIISVAASDQDDNLAYFSNYGAVSVDVAAPGTNIYSTLPGSVGVWVDNFDDGSIADWTTGGTRNSWSATNAQQFSGSYSLADSPAGSYLNDTDSWARTPAIDLSAHSGVKLEFKLIAGSELLFDRLRVQVSTNLVKWLTQPVRLEDVGIFSDGLHGTQWSWKTGTVDLGDYEGQSSVYIRFKFTSDASVTGDGAYIDDVAVTAAASSYSADSYGFYDGTSMATPHVSGLAALLKAHNPALTNIQIKAAILSSVNTKSSLNNRVATEGRINAAKALAAPQISNVQVSAVSETTAVITWTTDKRSDSEVRYGTAGAGWGSYPNTATDPTLKTSHSITLSDLSQATDYYFMVGSTDAYGNGPDNKTGDSNPAAEDTFTTADPDPPSIVEFPVINFAGGTITITYDEQDMQAADDEDNYSFSPSMNFVTVNPHADDIAALNSSTFRLPMASIPAYEIFTLTVSNITDLADNPVTPASIRINDNDNDSMADNWETEHGLNTSLNDSAADPDGDGYTNFEEYEDRTDPQSAASGRFVIEDSIPQDNAGIANTQRVPDDTSFAVLLESVYGININNDAAIEFTIDDETNTYSRDLGDASVRVVKLTNDDDSQVTRMWVVYDRSEDGLWGPTYLFDSDINIKIDAIDIMTNTMDQAGFDFNVETAEEHDDALNSESNPQSQTAALPPEDDYDNVIEVNSGSLTGAQIFYNNGEMIPQFGPTDEIPALNLAGVNAVTVPMNLQPPTVFNTPVKIVIPCPGYTDVSSLNVYYYNGSSWALACNAAGNVQPGGDGWMVPGSRVNHNETDPAAIEIQVYHFSGAQAGLFSGGGGGGDGGSGGGGGGGGCFIATASHGSLIKHLFFYIVLNLAFIGLGIYSLNKITKRK